MGNSRNYEFGDPYRSRRPPPQPEWPPEAFLVEGELPPPRFERDLENFRSATERINRFMPLENEPPEGMIELSRTQPLPFSRYLLVLQALRQRQYDIRLVGNAEDLGTGPLVPITIYTSPQDRPAIKRITMLPTLDRDVRFSLLSEITNGWLQNVNLLPGHGANTEANKWYAAIGGVQSEVYRRAFMTSILVRELRQSKEGSLPIVGALADIYRQDQLLYNKLRAEGVEPFSYEELFGIAESAITDAMRSSADIPPPHSLGTQAKEEEAPTVPRCGS